MMANASRGMKAEHELKTAVEGLSAILMELVDTEDPVEVGSDTTYEIKVTKYRLKGGDGREIGMCNSDPDEAEVGERAAEVRSERQRDRVSHTATTIAAS